MKLNCACVTLLQKLSCPFPLKTWISQNPSIFLIIYSKQVKIWKYEILSRNATSAKLDLLLGFLAKSAQILRKWPQYVVNKKVVYQNFDILTIWPKFVFLWFFPKNLVKHAIFSRFGSFFGKLVKLISQIFVDHFFGSFAYSVIQVSMAPPSRGKTRKCAH